MNYRLYTIVFETSTGLKIYGGKRHSKYKNPYDDPYRGSGLIISRAIAKYGAGCVKAISWSKCFGTAENLNEAEELLIDELMLIYGKDCANLISGGTGGGKYFNPADNPRIGKKRSDASKAKMSVSAKNRKWTPEGLELRKAATRAMSKTRKQPDKSGGKNPAAKSIKVGSVVFDTVKSCAEHFKLSSGAVIGRCKNSSIKWKEWNYVNV